MSVPRFASNMCVGAVVSVLVSAAFNGGFASVNIVERAIFGAVVGVALTWFLRRTPVKEGAVQ